MIPATKTAKVEGNLGGNVTAMTIRAEDMAHIMGVVTDLYSDKAKAILREYSTNALDAHKDAGIKAPIEVTLPTRFNQYLIIKDRGTGMDVTDLTETYGMFGRSTKRDSNEFNGCLGLGSKSALTYGHTFTVTSVKNGVKSEVVVYRDEAGLGQLNVVDTSSTNLPNGTTVTIPTKQGDDFAKIAAEFYKVWDKGTVLVDGVTPNHISDDTTLNQFGKHYIRTSKRGYGESHLYVIMGGVTYAQKMPQPKQFRVPLEIFTFVDIGEVEFVPSREALQLSKRTQAKVDELWADATQQYLDHFTQGFANAKTLREAIKLYLPMQTILGNQHGLKWKDIPMEDSIQYNGRCWDAGYRNAGLGSTSQQNTLHLSTAYRDDHAKIVNRKSKSSLNGGEKARLREYLNMHNLPYTGVIFNGADHEILGGMNEVDWTKVLADTKTSSTVKSARPLDEWEYYEQDTSNGNDRVRKFGPVPDSAVTILFISTTELKRDYYSSINLDLLKYLPHGTIIVMVNVNRQEKFKRDNTSAQHLRTYIDGWIARSKVSLTDIEKYAYAASGHWTAQKYEALKGKTNDPQIDLIHGTIEGAKKKVANVDQVMRMSRRGGFDVDVEDYLETTYPLVDTDHLDHSIAYINTIVKMGK